MIMVDHKHGRCWAYRAPNKGVLEEAYWLPGRMVQDSDNNGFKSQRTKNLQ